MNLNQLRPAHGARSARKRLGRGESSGLGKTSGKGNKGQNARSGNGKKIMGFEGGQMPLFRRIPKYGFNNRRFQTVYATVNVGRLQEVCSQGDVVDSAMLIEKGVLKKCEAGLKVLGDGEIKISLHVKAHKISDGARKKIEAAKGTVELIAASQ